jgi:hypothetical protein
MNFRSDHTHLRAGVQQSVNFPRGDFAAANHHHQPPF